jgi:hypothetical protein
MQLLSWIADKLPLKKNGHRLIMRTKSKNAECIATRSNTHYGMAGRRNVAAVRLSNAAVRRGDITKTYDALARVENS